MFIVTSVMVEAYVAMSLVLAIRQMLRMMSLRDMYNTKKGESKDCNEMSEVIKEMSDWINYYITTILANITWSFVAAVIIFRLCGVIG